MFGGVRGIRGELVLGLLPSRIFWSSSSSVGSISSQPSGGGFLLRFTFGIAAGTGMGGKHRESPPVRSPERAPRILQNRCEEAGGSCGDPEGLRGAAGAPWCLPVTSRCPPGTLQVPPGTPQYPLVPPGAPW